MDFKTKLASAGFATALMTSTALAGGLERGTYDPAILYEIGNRLEGSWGRVNPSVTSEDVAFLGGVSLDIAPSYTQMSGSIKLDLSDMFALALTYYEPTGYSLEYPLIGSAAEVESSAFALVGKYQATENFSVYGGINYVTLEGTADNLPGYAGVGLKIEADSDIGYIVGAAYEKKEIALRVSLTYETGTEHEFGLRQGAPGGPYPVASPLDAKGGTPEAISLQFQSGIAEGTLLFGSIRHARHSGADVFLPTPLGTFANLTNFSNSTTYKLGVGRKLTDDFSVSLSGTYERGSGNSNTLNPTNGKTTVSAGAKYDISENVDLSFGASYTWLGDNKTSAGDFDAITAPATGAQISFADNSAIAFGTKIGFSF